MLNLSTEVIFYDMYLPLELNFLDSNVRSFIAGLACLSPYSHPYSFIECMRRSLTLALHLCHPEFGRLRRAHQLVWVLCNHWPPLVLTN